MLLKQFYVYYQVIFYGDSITLVIQFPYTNFVIDEAEYIKSPSNSSATHFFKFSIVTYHLVAYIL